MSMSAEERITYTRAAQDKNQAWHYVIDSTKPGISPERVQQIYSEWAGSYEQDIGATGYNAPKHAAREVAELLGEQKDAHILDCAAGTGLVGLDLKGRGFSHIDALDASAEMLEMAKQKGVYNRLICDFMGTNRLDIPSNTYDALVAAGLFCSGHVGPDCFEELIRITKPGGFIVAVMRESRLKTDYKDNELEAAMQLHHDNKLWKWVTRKVIPKYHGEFNGLVFHFQVL